MNGITTWIMIIMDTKIDVKNSWISMGYPKDHQINGYELDVKGISWIIILYNNRESFED